MQYSDNPLTTLMQKLSKLESCMLSQVDGFDDLQFQMEKESGEKDAKISELQEQNDVLFTEVRDLKQELNSIKKEASILKQSLDGLKTEYDDYSSSSLKSKKLDEKSIGGGFTVAVEEISKVQYDNLRKNCKKERSENKWLVAECVRLRDKLSMEISKQPSYSPKEEEERRKRMELETLLGDALESEKRWRKESGMSWRKTKG
jgi:regulator of replication initiation timing